jgi:hypothetical protein
MEITIDQSIDVGYATLENYAKDDDRLEMTFKEACYQPVNDLFGKDKVSLQGGDRIEGFVTLGDTGNAKHISLWEEDSDNVVNTDKKWSVNWTHAATNMTYNRIELGMNMGDDVRVYNYLNGKRKNMFREFGELLQDAIFQTPTSSSDEKNPHGLVSWLSQGTDDSTGGFTAYSGRYNDGSGTAYDLGGIASSSSSNARWASYYADHGGSLGDNLLTILDEATIKTNFIPPVLVEETGPKHSFGNYRYFTNITVLKNLNQLALLSDDKVGPDLGKYHGMTIYKGVPSIYVQKLDTANTSTYGTDPLIAVNMDYVKVFVLESNNFVVSKPKERDQQHNVLKVHVDLSYAICCTNRQRAGFLINQQ